MSLVLALIPITIAAVGALSTTAAESGVIDSICLTTIFKDEKILEKSMQNYGCRYINTKKSIDLNLAGNRVVFQRNQQGIFEARFLGDITLEAAQVFINDLKDEYTKEVQQQVYQRLLARSSERGFILENEEVKDDNSIVLTLKIQ